MTAQEMFQKLNYSYHKFNDFIIYRSNDDSNRSIIFYLGNKSLSIVVYYISISLHKAIHKQMEEFGWIE